MDEKLRGNYPEMPEQVEVIDCTLRDGEQAPGVWFKLEEKLELATLLSDAGVTVLDAGFPAGTGADVEALQEMRRRGLAARIGATARPCGRDVALAEEAGAHEVFLFMPTSEFRLTETLGITREQSYERFRAGAEEVASRGMKLNLVFEDATRADPDQLVKTYEYVRLHAPVERLVLCDTVGCAFPGSMEALVHTLWTRLDRAVSLCTHCHNDFGFAGANTVAGVAAGARGITCTVNGIGERAGNADLAETVAALSHIFDVKTGIDPKALPNLSLRVERMSGIHTSPLKPVTGSNVYRHESGVHVHGMLKNPLSYEFLPSEWVGQETAYVLGKHSGKASIRWLLEHAGLPYDDEIVSGLLLELKTMTVHREKHEHERAFSNKRAFELSALSGVDPSRILASYACRYRGRAAALERDELQYSVAHVPPDAGS